MLVLFSGRATYRFITLAHTNQDHCSLSGSTLGAAGLDVLDSLLECGAVDDLPGHHDPSCGDGRDDHAASDIDVFGEEGGHIVGAGDDVGG